MNLVIDFILIGGIVITLIILWFLLKSKKGELPQKLLFWFFVFLLFFLLNAYAEIHKIPILFVITFLLSDSIEFIVGPIIYVYIKSLFENQNRLIKRNWQHFIPGILYIIFISFPFFISIFLDDVLFGYLNFLDNYSDIAFFLFMWYLLTYLVLSLRLFGKYKKAMQNNFSTLSESDFSWVKNMLMATTMVCLIDMLASVYEFIYGNLSWNSANITLVAVIIMIGYLGYYGVRQSKILLPEFLLQETNNDIRTSKKPKASLTDDTEFKNYKIRLLKTMQENEIFLDEDLTLNKLAQQIDITDKKLSLLLNQYMNTTFYDFINKYRVASVKEKMVSKDFENLTLLGIAYESGFKSKTSFNRIFKKETGVSPSEYKKRLKK